MGFNCGIIGLPNVGKSTIFNALTACQADAANYPFCTIEPNTGIVPVPDNRLGILAEIAGSAKIIATTIEFVDIAGLVKGASKGEGLGNQFLGHIRSVDALVHVVRCFDDSNITHVHGKVSPREDVEVIDVELIFADLASIERRLDRVGKIAKGGDKEAREEFSKLEIAKKHLEDGKMLRTADPALQLSTLGLITSKPVLYVANVLEQDAAIEPVVDAPGHIGELVRLAHEQKADVVVISGAVEAEIAQIPEDERNDFLKSIGLESSGLQRLALSGYKLLNLITFFTVGPKETHAWTCTAQTLAPQAAGVIHSDFEKGFIRAEVISFDDYVSARGESGARERGTLRVEGKNYVMKDGDIVHFRFNV